MRGMTVGRSLRAFFCWRDHPCSTNPCWTAPMPYPHPRGGSRVPPSGRLNWILDIEKSKSNSLSLGREGPRRSFSFTPLGLLTRGSVPAIVLCIRWYLTFKLSSRDLVQMMAERGIASSHTTILRWVQRYVPEFEKRWNRYARPVGDSWRVMRLISRSVVSGCTCIAPSTNRATPSIFS
jgi:hypothetical protein